MLPSDAEARKNMPIARGVLDYFPDALAAVAELSWLATQQHHPGEPMHWDKSKSSDEADCLIRHLIERGTIDSDGVRHSAKVAWRALALLQREIDAETVNSPSDIDVPRAILQAEAKVPRECPDLDQSGDRDVPEWKKADDAQHAALGHSDLGHRIERHPDRNVDRTCRADSNLGRWYDDV